MVNAMSHCEKSNKQMRFILGIFLLIRKSTLLLIFCLQEDKLMRLNPILLFIDLLSLPQLSTFFLKVQKIHIQDCVIREIFASLIMYNFSMLITDDILIDDDKHNKYRSKINYATAIHICIAFFRCNRISPSNLEKQIARNKCPVRPDRIATRKSCYHSAVSFNYRLS